MTPAGAGSSSMIVATAMDWAPSAAPTGAESVTVNVSSPSTSASSLIGIVTVLSAVSPVGQDTIVLVAV